MTLLNASDAEDAKVRSTRNRLRAELQSISNARGYSGFLLLDSTGRVLATDEKSPIELENRFPLPPDLFRDTAEKKLEATFRLPETHIQPGVDKVYGQIWMATNLAATGGKRGLLLLLIDPRGEFSEILQRGR